MKKYIFLYVIAGISIMMGFLFYVHLQKTAVRLEIDNVVINEITKEAALNWQNLDSLRQMNLTYRFIILNSDDSIRYASDENLPDNLTIAIRRGFLPMEIIVNNGVVGKALIEVFPVGAMEKAQRRLANSVFVTIILICVINIVFLFALHNILILPFIRMERFAHKITTGMFDEPLPMDKNNIFGLFTQSFDVMRTTLLKARQNQINLERAKKELIASLSHDIKTPLTSIRLISELLQAGTTDTGLAQKLKTIEIKAAQIDNLMNDLMHSALEELGELKVNTMSVESGILRELFKGIDDFSKIRIGEIPNCLIDLDPIRMEQVLGNIITNSYKYANTEIDVHFMIYDNVLRIDIDDYGSGVESETLELICTKFYRGENAKAMHKEGEGLGLYIAKMLMEKMCGGLEAFNRNNGFTIRLWIKLTGT